MEQRLRKRDKFGYACGQAGLQIRYMLTGTYLLWFFTDVALYPLASITLMMTITKIWDAINDPACGWLIDEKWKFGKHGKFRPMYIISALISCVMFGLMFTKWGGLSDGQNLVILWILYFASDIISTGEGTAYPTVAGMMTNDKKSRTSLGVWRSMGGLVGGMLISIGAVYVFDMFGGKEVGVTPTVWLFVIISMICCVICWKFMKEKPMPVSVDVREKQKNPIGIIVSVLKNKAVMTIIIVFAASTVATMMRSAMQMYYVEHILGNIYAVGAIAGTSMSVMAISFPLTSIFVKKYGSKNTLLISFVLQIVSGLAMIPFKTNLILIIVMGAIGGFAMALGNITIFTMQVDSIDYQEWKYGKRNDGIIYALYGFMQKIGGSLPPLIAGGLLMAFGYDAKFAITETAKIGIEIGYFIVPVIIYAIGLIALIFCPLTEKNMAKVREDLAVSRNSAEN